LAGKPQLLVTGLHEVISYDPSTGTPLWSCSGPSEVTANTVAWNDPLVFVSGGFPEKELFAVRADGTGDVTASHVVWRSKSGVTYVPSLLYHDGLLYIINDGGVATCLEAGTGKQLWQERLNAKFSSSPVYVAGRIYIVDEAGKCFVLKAGPKFEQLAANDLAGGGFATPTFCGSQLFLRTEHALYCIGARR
jgi:hypothetical protein